MLLNHGLFQKPGEKCPQQIVQVGTLLLNHGLFQDRDISRITIGYIIEGFFLNVYLNTENHSEMYPGKDFYSAF